MQIVSRAQWGARPPKSRVTGDTITETYLHHSVGYGPGGESYMRIMQNQHMDINGWSDIAYNFVVDPQDLRVFEGRGWGVRPGAQKSHNRGTWAVCVMGDYRITPVTQGLIDVLANLIRTGHELGHIPLVLTGGHRDAPNQSTTCPGARLHSRIPDIRNLLEADMAQKIPLETWAKDAFKWAVDNKVYTEKTNLGDIREPYEFQQLMVGLWRVAAQRKGHFPTGDGGITEARVKAIINDSQIVAG